MQISDHLNSRKGNEHCRSMLCEIPAVPSSRLTLCSREFHSKGCFELMRHQDSIERQETKMPAESSLLKCARWKRKQRKIQRKLDLDFCFRYGIAAAAVAMGSIKTLTSFWLNIVSINCFSLPKRIFANGTNESSVMTLTFLSAALNLL